MTPRPVQVGVIGCGTISNIYLKMARTFESIDVVACADLMRERAQAQAAKFDVPRVLAVDELLADPAIEMVLDLTIPAAHATVALAAIGAGKSVYNEKPLTLGREEGERLIDLAAAGDLRVGCAPDTFLGGGLQTCRQLLDSGAIGEPVAATAFFLGHGPEGWHPDPNFYYQPGAGPLFDMGPYYLTALVALLGPVQRVAGSARASFAKRVVGSGPKQGDRITVNTPTHVAGVLDFASGAIATLATSFDVWAAEVPCIEIYGSEGTLSVPDPNTFGGPVRLRKVADKEWIDVPLTFGHTQDSRGIGLADMAAAQRRGGPHRASGELAFHVLDIMHTLLASSTEGRHLELQSSCDRPAPFAVDEIAGSLSE